MTTREIGVIKLPAVLDLSAAEGFLATLLQASEGGEPIQLDASAVETITMPCVQIILAAKRGDDRLTVEHASAAFLSAFADFGLPWADGTPDGNELEKEASAVADDATAKVEIETANEAIPTDMDMDMAKRILTIDDSKTMRDMLMLTLSDAGYDVLQAVDGQDGIEVLGDRKVDVVITDINMPKMDGYAVIRNLRANPVHKSTPILVLTTESDTEKKNLARDAGATGWMVKPFDPDQLVATIRKVSP